MKRESRERILAAHPWCCFCGGNRRAVPIDHQPGRAFFAGKRMPDNTLYPACQKCQDVSRDAESLMSFVVTRAEMADADLQNWSRRHRSLKLRHPSLLKDLVPITELANELKSRIATPPEGFDSDDFITLDAALWAPVFQVFAKKLVLAMHYRVVGQPLKSSGGLVALLVPNGHHDENWDAKSLR